MIMKSNYLTIGIDLDNTIIRYDKLIYEIAVEKGLIPEDADKNKKKIRNHIRTLPGGEVEWQKIQGMIYGRKIFLAEPFEGLKDFLKRCRKTSYAVYVISHKTQFANYDDTQTDLRVAAHRWLETHITDWKGQQLIEKESVFFGGTRQEKIAYISALRCDWFIDDLEETFLESSFPGHTRRILFGNHGGKISGPIDVCPTWADVTEKVFGV